MTLGLSLAGEGKLGTTSVVVSVLAWALDYVAELMGAQKVGASKQALLGAAVSTVVGVHGLGGRSVHAFGRCSRW